MKGFNGFKVNGLTSRNTSERSNSERQGNSPISLNLSTISNFNLINQDSSYNGTSLKSHPALDWSEKQVLSWLNENGLSEFEPYFIRNDINGEVLLEINNEYLKMMEIPTVGSRVRIITAINTLKRDYLTKLRTLANSKQSHSAPVYTKDPNGKQKLSPIGSFGALLRRSKSNINELKVEQQKLLDQHQLNPIYSVPSPPISPDTQRSLRIFGSDGKVKIVSLENTFDATSILAAVLKCFDIDDLPEKYAIFLVNGEATRSLNDQELMDISQDSERSLREKLILRKKHLHMSHQQFSKMKGRKFYTKTEISSPSTVNKSNKLTKIFGARPPSELICNNLAQFFPEHEVGHIKNTQGGKSDQSTAISETLATLEAPRPRPPKNRQSTMPPAFRGSVLEPVFEAVPLKSNIDLKEMSNEIGSLNSRDDRSKIKSKFNENCDWVKGPCIGSGSFGDVYLGLNPLNGVLMAVKQVLLPDMYNTLSSYQFNQQRLDALQREIELLKGLDHPNIVSYLGSQISDSHLNILLEYVPGGSVSGQLADYGPFKEELIQSYVKQILDGLVFLHSQNIVHRDIKGGNILVDNRGKVKITDFGVSKKLQEEVLSSVTNQRTSLQGSIYWMAPEVIKQTHYTQKADIWALGCLVIEMLTGKHPYPHFNQMQAIFKIGCDIAPEIPENTSPLLYSFLEQTFIIQHENRPSAQELALHPFITEPLSNEM